MKLIAIETSSSVGSVAILDTEAQSREIPFPEGTRHGEGLVPAVDAIFREAGWQPREADVVAVSVGPGSYTGLRVGVVCAKMMAAMGGADLVAVPSLDVIARNAGDNRRNVCVAVNAGRAEVYTASYERDGSQWGRLGECAIVSPEELGASLRPETLILGDGVPIILEALGDGAAEFAGEEYWLPRAMAVAEIGSAMYAEGIRDDPYAIEPMYLRKSAAEEQWDRREAV